MTTIVTELVQILIAGITTLASGIGQGLNSMVTSAFVVVDASTNAVTGLSVFAQAIASFGAIGLAVGLTTLVVKWLMSWGARK